jgi:serine/threonine-protein kinase
MSTLFQRVFEAPTPLAEVAPHVPDAIADVVMRALATRADERYASAEDLGVALAEATAAVWGPGWVESCGDLVVTGSPRIETAGRRPSSPGGQEARSAGAPWPGTEELPCVRPAPSGRVLHSTVLDPAAEELVPIQQVVAARTRALPQLLVAVVLLLATGGLAFLTRGSPALTGSIPPGSLTVAGAHPAAGQSLALDTAQPVTVEATLPPTASAADSAKLSFSAVGVPLGAVTAPLEAADGGRVRAAIELGERRYLVPSGATATVSLLHGGSAVADASFPVRTTQSSWLTAPGVAAPLLLLFSLAYVESLLRSLRRGQRRLSAMPGLGVIGLALGVSLSLLAWIATGRPPTVAGLILCALGGGGFALAAGAASMRLARRRLATARPRGTADTAIRHPAA